MTDAERQQRRRDRQARAKKLEKHAGKKLARDDRERQLAERTLAAGKELGKTLYGVLLVDPPWRFEPWSRETGMDRAADNHYPTMTLDEITALAISGGRPTASYTSGQPTRCSTRRSTCCGLWGFTRKSTLIWVQGPDRHRVLAAQRGRGCQLIATRGKPPAPAPGTQPRAGHLRTARPA